MVDEQTSDDERDEEEDSERKEKKAVPAPLAVGGGMAAPPESEPDAGAPAWVTTFADLMSLLMCFFVMLLSMSQLDIQKFKAMAEGMAKGLGSTPSSKLKEISIDEILSQADVIKAKMRQKTINDANKLRKLLAPEILDRKIELEVRDQMITVRILQSGSFSAGSAELKAGFAPVAKRIREALGEIRGFITVSGHTDNQPLGRGGKYRSNWELSGSRAFSVIHALLKGKDLKEQRFVLTGHAETRPLADNRDKAGRSRNRRVEIVIDQRSVTLLTDQQDPVEETRKDADALRDVLAPEIKEQTIEVEQGAESIK